MIKGIEKLDFLTKTELKKIELSETNYKRFSRIYFEVLDYDQDKKEVIVKVWQNENEAGKYLTSGELISRIKEAFNFLPDGVSLYVRPIPYEKSKLLSYNIEDVRADMEKYSLQQKDLVKLLDIDKASINILLNGGRELTKYQKAMFYYFFEYMKLK